MSVWYFFARTEYNTHKYYILSSRIHCTKLANARQSLKSYVFATKRRFFAYQVWPPLLCFVLTTKNQLMALFALQYFDYLHASQKLSNRQSVQVWASTEDFRIFSNGFELRQTDRLWCKVIICVSFSSFAWGLLEKWRYRKVFWKCYVSPILKYMIHNQRYIAFKKNILTSSLLEQTSSKGRERDTNDYFAS